MTFTSVPVVPAVPTVWTFGSESSGFHATVSFDGSVFTVSCLKGAFDLKALWFSDGDAKSGEGGATLSKSDHDLAIGGGC